MKFRCKISRFRRHENGEVKKKNEQQKKNRERARVQTGIAVSCDRQSEIEIDGLYRRNRGDCRQRFVGNPGASEKKQNKKKQEKKKREKLIIIESLARKTRNAGWRTMAGRADGEERRNANRRQGSRICNYPAAAVRASARVKTLSAEGQGERGEVASASHRVVVVRRGREASGDEVGGGRARGGVYSAGNVGKYWLYRAARRHMWKTTTCPAAAFRRGAARRRAGTRGLRWLGMMTMTARCFVAAGRNLITERRRWLPTTRRLLLLLLLLRRRRWGTVVVFGHHALGKGWEAKYHRVRFREGFWILCFKIF